MKAIPSLDQQRLSFSPMGFTNFVSALQKNYRNLIAVINGKIGFGDGTNGDNIDGQWISQTFTLANTDVTIDHALGRPPVGYLIMSKDRACDVFTGTVTATSTQITLQCSVAGAKVGIFLV